MKTEKVASIIEKHINIKSDSDPEFTRYCHISAAEEICEESGAIIKEISDYLLGEQLGIDKLRKQVIKKFLEKYN